MTTKELKRIENFRNVKEGQRITFEERGKVYTRKVQFVYNCKWNDRYNFGINRIGSGTGYENIEPQNVISVK